MAMTQEEMAKALRSIPACLGHELKPVPCPDGNPGCCVAHLEKRVAINSAACCDDCARLIYTALRPNAGKG